MNQFWQSICFQTSFQWFDTVKVFRVFLNDWYVVGKFDLFK